MITTTVLRQRSRTLDGAAREIRNINRALSRASPSRRSYAAAARAAAPRRPGAVLPSIVHNQNHISGRCEPRRGRKSGRDAGGRRNEARARNIGGEGGAPGSAISRGTAALSSTRPLSGSSVRKQRNGRSSRGGRDASVNGPARAPAAPQR